MPGIWVCTSNIVSQGPPAFLGTWAWRCSVFQEAALKYPCPRMFLGLHRLFRVRAAQTEVLPEEVISSGWKDINYFMAEENLGEENRSTDSLSFTLPHFSWGFPHFKCYWMLYAAKGASELLLRRGWMWEPSVQTSQCSTSQCMGSTCSGATRVWLLGVNICGAPRAISTTMDKPKVRIA